MAAWAVVLTVLTFVFGLVILALAANYVVTALIKFAKIIGMPTVLIGALILGLGTSLPELSNSLMSVAKGITDLGVGNLIGAAITDLTLVLGLIFLLSKKPLPDSKVGRRILVFIALAAALFLLFSRDGLVARWEGAIIFSVFLIYQYVIFKKGFESLHEHFSARKLIIPYLLLPLALFSLILGAFLVLSTSTALAKLAGISIATIGLTVVAIGTTTPELIEGIIAARKGENELAIGGVLGGTAIIMLLVLSIISMVFSLKINYAAFVLPSIFLMAVCAYHLAYETLRKQTDKFLGVSLLAIYAIYIISNFI